jgi:hypothetical protein
MSFFDPTPRPASPVTPGAADADNEQQPEDVNASAPTPPECRAPRRRSRRARQLAKPGDSATLTGAQSLLLLDTWRRSGVGPEHKNRASFEREGGASWAGEGNGDVSARTGGTARHAGRSAESGLAGCCGLTQDGAALSASRSRPMNRTRAVGTTAERFV